MPPKKWNDEELTQAITVSRNFNDVAKVLGISIKSSSGKQRLKKRAEELELDFSHFSRNNKTGYRKHSLKNLFRMDCNPTVSIKRYFIESVIYACAKCDIYEWNGNPITLQVDHIDGNNRNNLYENLRLLCPNCHSQTDSWGVPKAYRNIEKRLTINKYGRSKLRP